MKILFYVQAKSLKLCDIQDSCSILSEQKQKDFVTICVACNKGVTRDDMKYVNGRVFHNECYAKHGNEYVVVDEALLNSSNLAKIELVQLKNLKIRRGGKSSSSKSRKPAKRKAKPSKSRKKKTTKRKAKRKTSRTKRKTTRTKRKTSRKVKRKTSRRKPARRTKKKASRTKKRTTRRTKTRTSRRTKPKRRTVRKSRRRR